MSDVEVMVQDADDVWRPGRLITWRWTEQSQGTWRAFVTYTRGVGDVRLHWVDGDQVDQSTVNDLKSGDQGLSPDEPQSVTGLDGV